MKTITKFKAIDGIEFTNKNECIKYELLIDRVNSIMNTLPKHPDSCDFANGSGYLQHDKTILKNAKVALLKICKEYIDHKWIQINIDDDSIHPSYVGRLLDDYGIKPLNSAWYRFQCIDSNLREWGQPYYANYPEKATQKCIS
ncbi:MAG: hypothetical protein PHU98_06295 [Mariniphaga sp.]|nr:hypothetical protein [Paludibacter sp.]MDD4225981.1 hypothetical protein [Mariniphaga sp.]